MYRNIEEGVQDYHKAWHILTEIGSDPQEYDAGRMFAAVEAGHKSLYALHKFDSITDWLKTKALPEWNSHVEWTKRQYFTKWLPISSPLNGERMDKITETLLQLARDLLEAKENKDRIRFKNLSKSADEIIFGLSCYTNVGPELRVWIDETIEEWDKMRAILRRR